MVHGFCVEFLSASAGNIILIDWLRYLADLAACLGGLAALAGGTVAETVRPPAGGEGLVIRLFFFSGICSNDYGARAGGIVSFI